MEYQHNIELMIVEWVIVTVAIFICYVIAEYNMEHAKHISVGNLCQLILSFIILIRVWLRILMELQMVLLVFDEKMKRRE